MKYSLKTALALVWVFGIDASNTTTPAGDPELDYADGVWMGGYYNMNSTSQSIVYVDQNLVKDTGSMDDLIEEARVAALRTIVEDVDVRFGGWRGAEPSFPDDCRLFSLYSDSICVFLFKLHGAENGRYLPLSISQKVTSDKAECINLSAADTYSSRGYNIADYLDKTTNAPDFLSLRLQGNVAVILYETTDCTDEDSSSIEPDIDLSTGETVWSSVNKPRYFWKFGHNTSTGKVKTKVDKVFGRLDNPIYEQGEQACACPDDASYYPPADDGNFLALWAALEELGYVASNFTSPQKVGFLNKMMDSDTSDDTKYALMELFLGPAYKNPAASPYRLTDTEIKAEIRRQVYQSIVVDGPSNLAYPFPDPCDLRFSPAGRRFRSIKVITDFELEAYGKEQCGATAASDARTLLASLADTQTDNLDDQLAVEGQLQTQMAEMTAARAAEKASQEAELAQSTQSTTTGSCTDMEICADIPSSYFPTSCSEVISFVLQSFSDPPQVSADVSSQKLMDACQTRCSNCST